MLLKKILAVLAGIVTSAVLIYCIEALGHLIYPPPPNIDLQDQEVMRTVAADMPIGALLMIILSWAIGAFGGGMVSALLAPQHGIRYAMITAGILIIFSIMNLVMIPQPTWFTILGLAVFVPGAYLGGKVAERVRDGGKDTERR